MSKMNNHPISDLFEHLAEKSVELERRARLAAASMKTGADNRFLVDMALESARAVTFWAETLQASISGEEDGRDA
jgi:hypothetical protein